MSKKHKDPVGDRLKAYERAAETILDPAQPLILRLDGRAFHSWTRVLKRPYDPRLGALMERAMVRVAAEVGARYCYTQSDEITLVVLAEGKAEVPFGGRTQKLASVLASLAAAQFNTDLPMFGVVTRNLAAFDCRAYNVPDKATAAEVVLWREADAIRNSSLGRGQEFFSAKALHRKSAKDVRAMLREMGKAWGELPPERKFGTAYARRTVRRKFWVSEIQELPAKHEARKNPDLLVDRQDYVKVQLPLRWLVTNPVDMIFAGAEPAYKSQGGTEDDEVTP